MRHTHLSDGSGVPQDHTHILSGNADEHLALSPDGKYVRRKAKYERLSVAELGFCKATKAVQISLQIASGSKHTGVMVSADVRYVKLAESVLAAVQIKSSCQSLLGNNRVPAVCDPWKCSVSIGMHCVLVDACTDT